MTASRPGVAARRAPLGRPFGALWTAAAFSNLADGLGRTAVPLIATTLTRDPVAIAAVAALAFVPWLVFGLPSGIIVDRYDRRRVMALANLLRGAVALGLAVLTVIGGLTIWWLFAGVLVFGFGETLFDNATNAVIPSLVRREGLDRANGRMQAAQVTIDSFVTQPIAGVLFAVSLALPLWSGAVGYLVPIVLALLLPVAAARHRAASDGPGVAASPVAAPAPPPGPPPSAGGREALRYLRRHRYLRGLVVFTSFVGCAFAFAQAPTLLYFLDVHAVAPAAIGFVTAGIGVGALAGSLTASAWVGRFGRGAVMLVANVVAGAALVLVGLAPDLVIAVVAYALLAFAIATWNVPWGALRQMIVPGRLFGRVLGIIRTLTWGVFPVATLLGGLVARVDLRLPFLVAGGAVLVATLVCARMLFAASAQTPAADD